MCIGNGKMGGFRGPAGEQSCADKLGGGTGVFAPEARSRIAHSQIAQLFCVVATGIFVTTTCVGADLSQAVVREKVNVVTLAPNLNEQPHPAAQGAIIRDENVVRTGTESRAELEFTDLTLARL